MSIISHQNEKKIEYGPRAREVEKTTLTAAVMNTSGGTSRGENGIRRRIRFDLLRTCVIALLTLDNFGMFEESPQLGTSGSARLFVTIQSNKLLLLAAL